MLKIAPKSLQTRCPLTPMMLRLESAVSLGRLLDQNRGILLRHPVLTRGVLWLVPGPGPCCMNVKQAIYILLYLYSRQSMPSRQSYGAYGKYQRQGHGENVYVEPGRCLHSAQNNCSQFPLMKSRLTPEEEISAP